MPRHFKLGKARNMPGRVNYGAKFSPVKMASATQMPLPEDVATSLRVYKDFGTFALLRNLTIYTFMRPKIVQNANTLLNLSLKVFGSRLTYFILRETAGKVFMAGQNHQELEKSQKLYKKNNIHSINDFGCEGVVSAPKQVLETNLQNYLKTLKKAAEEKRDTIAIKITGITYLHVLKELTQAQTVLHDIFHDLAGYEIDDRVNKTQFKEHLQDKLGIILTNEEIDEFFRVGKRDSDDQNPDELNAVEYYANIHAFAVYPEFSCAVIKKVANLSPKLETELRELADRLICLAEEGKKLKTGFMVDAEQTFIQAAICSMTRQIQRKYNVKKAMILNTYQGYAKAALRKIKLDIQGCHMTKIGFGAKLVRGAYVREENELAEKEGRESPICGSAEETSLMFDSCVEYAIANLPKGSHFNIATHNSTSLSVSMQAMERNPEKTQGSTISFAQLIGLGENLTYELAKKGQLSYKYMPFGPTPILAQYLLRRAEEASYISVESQKMKKEILKELIIYRWHFWSLTVGAVLGAIIASKLVKNKK